MNDSKGWIGVDFDGTLATYDGWISAQHTGRPIQPMIDRVRAWLKEGQTVKIFTARVYSDGSASRNLEAEIARAVIEEWCLQHIGVILPITCMITDRCLCLYSAKCIQVEFNTGRIS